MQNNEFKIRILSLSLQAIKAKVELMKSTERHLPECNTLFMDIEKMLDFARKTKVYDKPQPVIITHLTKKRYVKKSKYTSKNKFL